MKFLLQPDKALHFTVSYALMLTLALLLPLLYAAAIVLVIGAGKEWYDYKHPLTNTADWLDFAADTLGAGLAVAVINILSIVL